jgi:hypothetical protein
MSMLDRYRRPGGFLQLLALLETCGATKQERFLEIIRSEDPRWAGVIKTKMLDMPKIYSWKDEVFAEVLGRLQDLTLAVLVIAAPPEVKARVHILAGHSRWRKIEGIIATTEPTPADIATTHMKVIETVRAMVKEGALRFERFDPSLVVEDGIEDKIAKGTLGAPAPFNPDGDSYVAYVGPLDHTHPTAERPPHIAQAQAATASTAPAAPSPQSPGAPNVSSINDAEVALLRRKVNELTKENAQLRQEVGMMRAKLEQIRRIA